MLPAQNIDFTRGDIGSWIFFVLIPFLFIIKTSRLGKGAKFERRMFFNAWNWLIVSGATLVLVGLLQAWRCFGPQYILKMKVSEETVILGFHWPNPDRVIPIKSLTKVSFLRIGGTRPFKRVQIETANENFLSFGFHRLQDQEYDQLRALIARIGQNQPLEAGPR